MKVKSLHIKNVGKIADEKIAIDKPLVLFFGDVRAGKSTILNAVRWVCGGPFPDDIIRHGEECASILLEFDECSIERSFYIAKDGSTKARDVIFVRNGKQVKNPVAEIKRLLNPCFFNQNYLADMGESERRRYFADTFGVDTVALDTEAMNLDREARELRAKIWGYGDIDATEVKPVEVAPLKERLKGIREVCAKARSAVDGVNNEIEKQQTAKVAEQSARTQSLQRIADYEESIEREKKKLIEIEKRLAAIPDRQPEPYPPEPDTTELESMIENAGAQNMLADQYQKNLKRISAKAADEEALMMKVGRIKEIRETKIAKLAEISDNCGIPGLEFDEFGNFAYQKTSASMLSTSQIMELSVSLSAMYPESEFAIDLIDRAESLGKSIFGFIDRAVAENKTILATIVGERPANTPPEVGVFVVEDGKVIS